MPFLNPEFARTLFDESGDAMFLVDPVTDELLDANKTAVRLTGFTPAELRAVPGTSLFRFDRGPANAAKAAAQKTTVFHGRDGYQLRTKADPGWLAVSLTVTRLHVKPHTFALMTARDDSDRRAALEAARRSEERFRALVENSVDGILVLDGKGVITYASPAVYRVLGYTPAEVVGRDGFALAHPDDVPALRAKFEYVLGHPGQDVPHRCRAGNKAGEWRVVDMVGCSRLADPSVRGVVLNYRDVTDRVKAEGELAGQHGLLRTLIDAVPDVICLKDRDLLFRDGNPAFERMAGRPVAEVVGKSCLDVFTGDWAARMLAAETRVLRTGEAEREEMWVDHADGRPRFLDVMFAPTGPAGKPEGLAVVGRDLTDRKKLEDQLREAQKMEAVGQLAGGVAHDFNNLLTVIIGNLELARTGAEAPAPGGPADEILMATDKAARRAADLTGQLLGFARRKPMRFVSVGLNEVVRETAALLRRTIDPKVVIREYPRPGLWAARGDPGQLNQVLMNLCLNARDAIPGAGTITITTANADVPPAAAAADPAARPGKFVRVTVRDTGAGMTPDVKARVFEPFFTTKDPGRGTGLGLAVVFGIVQAHAGWIACDTAPGEGTAFEVYLPRHEGTGVHRPTPAPTPSPLGQGERILLADDEAMIRDLGKAILGRLGYLVTVAADGAEAVTAFREAKGGFAAVILDLTMPNVSGREALEQIRALDATVPVILASGYSADTASVRGTGARFLDKPYTPADLGKAVRQAIDARRG